MGGREGERENSNSKTLFYKERERGGDTDRQTDRDKETKRDRDRERQREMWEYFSMENNISMRWHTQFMKCIYTRSRTHNPFSQEWSTYVCEKDCRNAKVFSWALNSDRVGILQLCRLAGSEFKTDGARKLQERSTKD